MIQFAFSLVLGLYVIWFARSMFSQPDRVRQRWYSWLPQRPWASTLLRCYAFFGMFGGFVLIASGTLSLPWFDDYRGMKLLAVVVVTAAVSAILLAVRTPRRKGIT